MQVLEEEWYGIYHDVKDYDICFGVAQEIWEKAEKCQSSKAIGTGDEIVLPGGHMTIEQLTALLNTIPMEITFVDAENINRFFNEGAKVFKRPGMAIDREVFSCHPPKIEPMVRQIIDDFRNNRRDEVPVWMEKGGRTMLVKFPALFEHKSISLILRHKPEVIGMSLDEHGWANVDELIAGVSKTHEFDMALLEEIVRTDDKQRYSFNQDKTLILWFRDLFLLTLDEKLKASGAEE